MPTLVATVGASTANSYCTVEEATTYFDERLNASAWTSASADDKARALIAATRRIDQETFEGEPVNPLTGTSTGTTQALKWPRYSADDDARWTWESTVIPVPVKYATMKLALYLLNQGTDDPAQDTGLEGFEELQVGPIKLVPRESFPAGELPADVLRELRPVLRTQRNNVRLVRG